MLRARLPAGRSFERFGVPTAVPAIEAEPHASNPSAFRLTFIASTAAHEATAPDRYGTCETHVMMQEDDGWQDAMRSGDFSRAWAISDRAIRAREADAQYNLPRHFQSIWNGSPLQGRVLIRCYHGLGDTLQFCRYVPLVQRTATVTTLWVQPALVEVLRPLLSGVRLLPLHDGTPSIEYDIDIEIMELAHAFRTTLETIPPPLWQDVREGIPPDGPLRIGLVWASGNWDPGRNIPFELLHELLQCDVHWILLQDGATAAERRQFDSTAPIDTIPTLAAAMRSCDLVITVDTMAAHLAGSLGVPTWTLLRNAADWRWLSGRSDSPWYPAMRVYRQRSSGEWLPVLHEVVEHLNAIATTRLDRGGPGQSLVSVAQKRAENMR